MSEAQLEVQEPEANPYNAKKSWHKDEEKLFTKPEATEGDTNAPEVEEAEANYKKRYDDLKRHYDSKIAEFKTKEQELQTAAEKNAVSAKPPKTLEELETFKDKYPDLYDTVQTVAQLQTQKQTEGYEEKFKALEKRERDAAIREARVLILEAHNDYEELRASDDFHSWVEAQPAQIQDWVYDNPDNAQLAIKAIDLYKLETGSKVSRKKSDSSTSNQSAADMVSTKTTQVDTNEKKVWSRREIQKLTPDQFEKYEAEIDAAISEGRVAP